MSYTQHVHPEPEPEPEPELQNRTWVGPWGDFRLEDRLQKILFGWASASDWVGEEHHYHNDNGSELYVTYSQDENYSIQQIRVTTTRGKMAKIAKAIRRVNEAEQGGYQRGTSVFSAAEVRLREYDNTREHHGHNAPKPEDNVPHYKEKKFKTVF